MKSEFPYVPPSYIYVPDTDAGASGCDDRGDKKPTRGAGGGGGDDGDDSDGDPPTGDSDDDEEDDEEEDEDDSDSDSSQDAASRMEESFQDADLNRSMQESSIADSVNMSLASPDQTIDPPRILTTMVDHAVEALQFIVSRELEDIARRALAFNASDSDIAIIEALGLSSIELSYECQCAVQLNTYAELYGYHRILGHTLAGFRGNSPVDETDANSTTDPSASSDTPRAAPGLTSPASVGITRIGFRIVAAWSTRIR
mmetsp:Transcript_17635/g.34541  ORF Transcript_17635/g.34541 Transcript_17635/m.34541 type:complete len:257 (-) Transcript_17635:313-1083(-)